MQYFKFTTLTIFAIFALTQNVFLHQRYDSPTQQALNIVINNINTNSAYFASYEPGNGDGRAVFIKQGGG
ncbi:MAG: hypothetical protein V1773_06830 [bacterium]